MWDEKEEKKIGKYVLIGFAVVLVAGTIVGIVWGETAIKVFMGVVVGLFFGYGLGETRGRHKAVEEERKKQKILHQDS